jgi:hypothetical protein
MTMSIGNDIPATSRRDFIRSGLALGAVGITATATSALLLAGAKPAHAAIGQSDWRFCQECYCLFYAGFGKLGLCAAGGQHRQGNSYNYVLLHDHRPGEDVSQQLGWAYCPRCEMLTWGNGWCPGSGHHILEGNSENYGVFFNASGDNVQQGWRYCRKCQNLAFAGYGAGPCAYSGRHDHRDSYHYALLHHAPPPSR